MSDDTFQSRFLVRQGGKGGWMVYDRQRKGPAMIGMNPAEKLTEEQAHRIKRTLAAGGGEEARTGITVSPAIDNTYRRWTR